MLPGSVPRSSGREAYGQDGFNEVAGQPDADPTLALVLDDYHVISSPPAHKSLGCLLEHRPPGLHLALASLSDLPLAPEQLRALGQLTEPRSSR